jgi:hypothetical protein
MKQKLLLLASFFAILIFTSCSHIEITVDAPSGGTLEDALLIMSANGDVPREVYVVGDLDLSVTTHEFDKTVKNELTHWWLIGSINGRVVYTSNTITNGTDLYAVEPYTGAELAWNIPNNLDAYANGDTYSFDWWAQTINNHSSHVAEDSTTATLYLFSTAASSLGTVLVDLRK